MDRKATDYYLGVGGAFCDICSMNKEKCHDVNIIRNGIIIDKYVDTLHRIFEELVKDDGTIRKSKNDYVRQGVINKAIATNQAFSAVSS